MHLLLMSFSVYLFNHCCDILLSDYTSEMALLLSD